MQDKTYKRKPIHGILQLLVGVIFVMSVLREQEFRPMYDSLKLVVAVMAFSYGVWCLVKPLAVISGDTLFLNKSPFNPTQYKLDTIESVEVKGPILSLRLAGDESVKFAIKPLSNEDQAEIVSSLKNSLKEI